MFWRIILYVFIAYTFLSTVVFILSYYELDWQKRFKSRHRDIFGIVELGTVIYCLFVVWQGIEGTLFFIPNSWGSFDIETGEFETIKSSISFFLGLLITLYLGYIFDKLAKLHKENEINKELLKKYLPKRQEENGNSTFYGLDENTWGE